MAAGAGAAVAAGGVAGGALAPGGCVCTQAKSKLDNSTTTIFPFIALLPSLEHSFSTMIIAGKFDPIH
jgi:hypothetical protein